MTKSLHRHYKSHGKERRKRCVFRRLQKTGRDGADVTWCGRSFQVRVAATGKARSPTVDSRVRWTDSDDVDAERRRVLVSESADWRSSSARYNGAVVPGRRSGPVIARLCQFLTADSKLSFLLQDSAGRRCWCG